MWQLRPESLAALAARLDVLKPQLMVEAGSGKSTVLMAQYGRLVSLEHLTSYAKRSQQAAPTAEVRLCRLRPFHTYSGTFQWYDTELPNRIDFALIDGPPGLSVGREAALFALWPYLTPDRWEIWLDDADRQHEQHCLEIWRENFSFRTDLINSSLIRLRPTTEREDPPLSAVALP